MNYVFKQIQIKNIRGFADLQFDLSRPGGKYAGWTVFTGDNGSGKSTLLRAIAVALVGKATALPLQSSFNRWIRDGAGNEESYIQLEIVRTDSDDELTIGGAPPGPCFPAKITLKNGGKATTLQPAIPPRKPKNYLTPDRSIWAPDAKGWFSCGYGPFRRVFGASPEATRHMVAAMTERFVTMFQEAASLRKWTNGCVI
ncbi:MAG: ATP-binding protein [Candidatus Omnitrophica bacterium]|nr:ATP-binding protein [Candidatus Omnitrophota bacterium]